MPVRLAGALAGALLLLGSSLTYGGDQTIAMPAIGAGANAVHKLVIAARSETIITEERADDIIQAMNNLIRHSNSRCSGVTFVRDGPIHYNSDLKIIGPVSDIVDSLDQDEPAANVLVVLSMDYCGGRTMISGCAPVGAKGNAMLVRDDEGRAAVVWAHERGHIMGLEHVAEGVDQNKAAAADLANVMYWQALPTAHLLTPPQCDAYINPGIVLGGPSAAPTIVVSDSEPPSPAPQPRAALGTLSVPADDMPQTLTQGARDVLYRDSWIHGMPLNSVQELENSDVASIVKSIDVNNPLPPWDHMLAILAYKASPEFLEIAKNIMSKPNVDVPGYSKSATKQELAVFAQKSEQQNSLIRAKVFIPTALGIYAYQSKDFRAASFLSALADKTTSVNIVGADLADDVSNAAVAGLAIGAAKDGDSKFNDIGAESQKVLRAKGDEYKAVFSDMKFEFKNADLQSAVEQASPKPPIVVEDKKLDRATTVFEAVKNKGLDEFILNGVGTQ
jgi:hypothetical protein